MRIINTRTINTIAGIGMLTGVFGLALLGCEPKNDDHSVVKPKSADEESDADKGDKGIDEQGDKKKGTCGGIGGLQCPTGQTCVDDPSDTCDPMTGGADCMGMCVKSEVKNCDFAADPNKTYIGQSKEACATMKFVCEEGKQYFADDCGCGCMITTVMK
jgi:hypothetical protein